jgi:hypothetical protein
MAERKHAMNGEELLEILWQMPDESLKNDISLRVDDEYYTLTNVILDDPKADGILDDGNIVLASIVED